MDEQKPQEQIISVKYRMLSPLIRIEIETKGPLHYSINENITIVVNDLQVFQNFNVVNLENFTHQHFSGMSSMVFQYNPLMVTLFPFVDNYPEHATKVVKDFLDAIALFKTTTHTKFKEGPRIVQTITEQNMIQWLNIQGSDDTHDFKGRRYKLTITELDEFKEFYNKLIPIIASLNENKILPAIDFYSRASRHFDIAEKFIFLSLALETLFSQEEDELSYRFSNRISLLLGNNYEERARIAKSIKNVVYKRRSMIVHGSNLTIPPEDEYEYLNEIIRVSILRYLSLITNGVSEPISELDSFLLKQNSDNYEDFKNKALSKFGGLAELRFQNIRSKPSRS